MNGTDRMPELDPLIRELRRAGAQAPDGAIADLISHGGDAVPILIDLLEGTDADEDDWTPLWAAVALGELKDERAVPALLRLLELPEGDVLSEAAVEALAKIGPRALPMLLVFAKDARSWETRHYAYAALGLIPGDASLAALLNALETDPLLWSALASALADLGDPRALPPLKRLLPKCDDGEAAPIREAIAILEGKHPAYPKLHEKPWQSRYAGIAE